MWQAGVRVAAGLEATIKPFDPGFVSAPRWKQLDPDLMKIGAPERAGQAFKDFSAGI